MRKLAIVSFLFAHVLFAVLYLSSPANLIPAIVGYLFTLLFAGLLAINDPTLDNTSSAEQENWQQQQWTLLQLRQTEMENERRSRERHD
jgi:uncharacterized membrane protein